MFNLLVEYFKLPEFSDIEQSQKAKFLHFSLFVTAGACLLLGILNLGIETHLDNYLFLVAVICLFCIPGIKRGYYAYIASFISVLLLAVITFSLMDGVALWDAGMIAYPVFMVFTSFLFSRRAAIVSTLLSMASVALVHYLDLNGYLTPSPFSTDSQFKVIMILLLAAGALLWAVMENWRRIVKDLKETYDLTLSGWSKALEFRDRETEGHSQRVVIRTLELAKKMGVPRQELEHIRRGVILHDIGKMAVPDTILLREGSLTDEEWEVVKKHPQHARELLENIPYLKPALDIPYCHHEKWDGSGYPQGLSGEDIPLAARIFSVVDVWDALISDRPYFGAWPASKAGTYIKEQSGKSFDPRVVEAFLKLIGDEKREAS